MSLVLFISHSDSSGSPLPDLSALFDSLPGPSGRSGNSSPRERELFTPDSLLSEPQLLELGMEFEEAGRPGASGQAADANAPTPDGPAPRPVEAPQQPLSAGRAGGASGAGPSRPPPPKRRQCQVGGTADSISRPRYQRNNRRRRRRRWDSWRGPCNGDVSSTKPSATLSLIFTTAYSLVYIYCYSFTSMRGPCTITSLQVGHRRSLLRRSSTDLGRRRPGIKLTQPPAESAESMAKRQNLNSLQLVSHAVMISYYRSSFPQWYHFIIH